VSETLQKFEITEEDHGKRADVIVARELPDLSRGFIKKLAHNDKLKFNGQPVQAGYKLKTTGQLVLDYDTAQLAQIPEIELPILHEDGDIIVINKPSGIITHARGKYWDEASVASSIRRKLARVDNSIRAGIVHRLDRATSGVIICGKTPEAIVALQKQFADRTVVKKYVAWVEPTDISQEGIIDKPIARNPKQPSLFRVDPNGKPAQTKFQIQKSSATHMELLLTPKTGRTHQLRVHLASIKAPIIGDTFYGGAENSRLLLHAKEITLVHPTTDKEITFEAPLPSDFTIESPQ